MYKTQGDFWRKGLSKLNHQIAMIFKIKKSLLLNKYRTSAEEDGLKGDFQCSEEISDNWL